MSALRDRVLNTPLDDLVAAAERGEVDPYALWLEVLESVDRSVAGLGKANAALAAAAGRLDTGDLARRQDRIDAMIAEWRAELDSAGVLPAGEAEAAEASKAYRGG
jgi:hypothetical protein